jgi:hypothetical protein
MAAESGKSLGMDGFEAVTKRLKLTDRSVG